MNIELTETQWQAIVDLIDKEVRVNGAQAAIHYGPIAAAIVTAAQEQKNADVPAG